ncbi:MAG: serine/threonine protein kinase, partial [Deltaproteobacteria bacterium]|nr:serine/threonine protein kinase [Deltaproteobacteria bacterium]
MSKVRSQTSLSDVIGEDFGPYRLVRRLGVGGMAETFEAIRRGPSGFAQHVCLKLVLPFFRDNEDFVRLFEREARLAAKLRHSNIVGVIDFGEIDGTPYMALELVDGADLRVLLDAQDGTRLPHELVALFGHDLAAALEHAHAPGAGRDADGSEIDAIVHRDISPGNVLVSRRGEVLLSDFGVAKAISGTSRKQSAVKGKIPYMSPEQLRAEPLDGRADLFALGVVLFEALGGQRPYDGAHDPATIMLTLSGDHPSLHGLAPDAPPELCDVIESLLRPDRDERPESASVLIDLLDEFVPSQRARRKVGKLVADCRAAEDRLSKKEALALAAPTKVTDPRPRQGGTGAEPTGGAPSMAGATPLGAQDPGSGARTKRGFGRALAGVLL